MARQGPDATVLLCRIPFYDCRFWDLGVGVSGLGALGFKFKYWIGGILKPRE